MAKKKAKKKAKTRRAKTRRPETTSQRLGSLIKSARDIMRKDKGLNGDLDRLPMLTWIMFLKFLDDMEYMREEESSLGGTRFRAALDAPYRWRDWAAQEDGITGDELLAFINQDEAVRPDGSRGPGLFASLRNLQSANGRDRRDVIASVFGGVLNRMVNGYLLRDVINKVNGIHFTSHEEIHTLGHLYETMLKEMRDAAGDSGEFYTPRPVIRFMVKATDPKLGEKILDPACGTGGFLVEAFAQLSPSADTIEQRKVLQEETLYGQEAKSLPFMLAQMNLLLHGVEFPQVIHDNSLATRLTEIGDKDRVDVILTNPPFGGEEEPGIKANFPSDLQTSETALLFLQLIMRRLRRQSHGSSSAGRAAMVVSDGFLFNVGVAARVKKELLDNFNLHTIVRLPFGVFEPYTPIRTNLIFFDRTKQTSGTWFYEIRMPDERKKYTKTKPMRYEEFLPCLSWWADKKETDASWFVGREQMEADNYNLDFKNPNDVDEIAEMSLAELVDLISENEEKIAGSVDRLRAAVQKVYK